MGKALGKRTIDALRTDDGKPAFAWCEVVPGFGVKASPGGVITFVYQYRLGTGRGAEKRRLSIGRYGEITVEQARQIAKEWAFEVANGRNPGQRRTSEALTVAELVGQWANGPAAINRRTGAPRSALNVRRDADRIAAHVLPSLGKRPATSITRRDIETLRDRIAAGATAKPATPSGRPRGMRRIAGGAGTAACTLRVLQSVFAYAVDSGAVPSNPITGVKLAPTKKVERFLSNQEAARLAAALEAWDAKGGNPLASNVVRGLMLTGCRLSEVSALRWSEVDFERGFLRLEATKAGKSTRPLSAPALAFFSGLPRLCPVFVFPATRGATDAATPFQGTPKAWRSIRDMAGLPDLRLHDLRHSYASFAAAAGVPLVTIGKLLGHSSPTTTARYAHLAEDAARRGADLAAAQLANALGIGVAVRADNGEPTNSHG